MKKLILTVMMLASFQSIAAKPEVQHDLRGQDGGGGGVLKRDGMYLTFGSAGLKVKLSTPQEVNQIPSLDLLINVLDSSFKKLDLSSQGRFVDAVLPSETRRYFKIDKSQLETNTYKKLIEEYAKLFKNQVDPANLAIAALTLQGDTFLLPPFYELKPAEQAAILFHESLWIIKPNISYEQLVNAEIVMQKHIETFGASEIYNEALFEVIAEVIHNPAIYLRAALLHDIQSGTFEKYKIPVGKEVFKQRVVHYNLSSLAISSIKFSPGYDGEEAKATEFLMLLRRDIRQYPDLKFLKALYKFRNKLEHFDLKYIPVSESLNMIASRDYAYSISSYKCLDSDYDPFRRVKFQDGSAGTNGVCFYVAEDK